MSAGPGLLQRLRQRLTGRVPIVLQGESAECVLACLAMVAGYHGRRFDLVTLRARLPLSLRGATLRTAIGLAARLGFAARPVRVEPEALRNLSRPALLHWDFNHFVVLAAVGRHWVKVHDPAVGARRYRLTDLSDHFTGIALELTPTDGFEPGRARTPLSLATLIGPLSGLRRALVLLLTLSAITQVFALASPFYIQLVVDEVLLKHDADLLTVLAIGFAMLAALTVLARALRALAGLYVVSQLNLALGARLFARLIRLPLGYFWKRRIGDVLSRFGSLRPVQELITSTAVATVIDGALALGALALMLLYAPGLTALVVTAVVLYTLARLAVYQAFRNRTHDEIVARAEADSLIVETVQSIPAIRSYREEPTREAAWLNRLVDQVNGGVRVRRLEIGYECAQGLTTGLELVAVIYFGARGVLAGELTVGMLYAFIAYRGHFTGAMTALVDQAMQWRMIGLHLERLADIVLTEPDRTALEQGTFERPLREGLQLRDATCRYGAVEAPIFEALSLTVPLGHFVAIAGPSGSGKTTLLRMLCGQIEPTEGLLQVDGLALAAFGVNSFRSATATVMQEDRLLNGTLRDNITFFDPEPDPERLLTAARLALIHDEILGMPMGYDSLAGDQGSALSSRQAQRVLIARALYRQPVILFLDEGTAHLDATRELAIMRNLREHGVTCVYTSHRPDIVALADQRLVLPVVTARSAGAHV